MPPASRPPQTPIDRNTPPPRKNWFVALTAGILRGIGSLFTAIARRLEARPSDPRPSLGLWGLAIALGVTVAIVTRSSMGVSQPVSQPVQIEIATDTTGQAGTRPDIGDGNLSPSAASDSLSDSLLMPTPLDPDSDSDSDAEQESRSPMIPTDLDLDTLSEPSRESESGETAALAPTTPDVSTTPPSEERDVDTSDVDTSKDDRDREPLPEIPRELTAPTPALALQPAPPPLTPEQRLIAALQERIAAISEDYATDAIVTTVQVDFARNHLDVELADRWYDLDEAEQDRLATDLRDRGEQFDFYDINLLDASGQLVARPAAIGNTMIVVRRLRD